MTLGLEGRCSIQLSYGRMTLKPSISRTGEQICRLLSVSKKVGLLVFVRNGLTCFPRLLMVPPEGLEPSIP